MRSIDRRKLALLMILHLLWGSVLWFSISKLGLGLSTDSVSLLFGGTNLAAGQGLFSFDGSPLILWPPLYPALLAGLHLLTGTSTFAAAHMLQVIAYVGLSVCVSILFLRIFPDDFIFALAGSLLSDIGVVVIASFATVDSDYIHLLLVSMCMLLVALYLERPSGRLYAVLFIVAMLAMLQRYLGISAIALAAVGILLCSEGSRRQRIVRAGFILLAAVPSALWLVLTAPLAARRPPVSFAQNFGWFTNAIVGWFLPADAIAAHPVFYPTLLWISLAMIAFALWMSRKSLPRYAEPILLFGVLYTLALFGSASITYYNRLEGRFLLPLYIPFVAGLLLALRTLLASLRNRLPTRYAAGRLAALGLLGLIAVLLLSVSVPAIITSHSGIGGVGDNVFNTFGWRRNSVLRYWQAHRPTGPYVLLSNQPDGVAFYTQHSCGASPRSRSGPYGEVEFPVESYAASLFESGLPVYILWIEPEDRSYYYRPEDLAAIADVQQLHSGPGGAVYRLKPKASG